LAEYVPLSRPLKVRIVEAVGSPLAAAALSVRLRLRVYTALGPSTSGLLGVALLNTDRFVATMSELPAPVRGSISLVRATPPVPDSTAIGVRSQLYVQKIVGSAFTLAPVSASTARATREENRFMNVGPFLSLVLTTRTASSQLWDPSELLFRVACR